MVKEAIKRRCRCHGLSGVCHYRTCWDQLGEFDSIASKLKLLYLRNTTKAVAENSGTSDKPDLFLARSTPFYSSTPLGNQTADKSIFVTSWKDLIALIHNNSISTPGQKNRVKPGELLYLYESPDYCEPQPKIKHQGTKGRSCRPMSNLTAITEYRKLSSTYITESSQPTDNTGSTNQERSVSALGSCEQLCCNRGYYSELVLDIIACNCRFKFCCKVVCEQCLQQRLQYFCL